MTKERVAEVKAKIEALEAERRDIIALLEAADEPEPNQPEPSAT